MWWLTPSVVPSNQPCGIFLLRRISNLCGFLPREEAARSIAPAERLCEAKAAPGTGLGLLIRLLNESGLFCLHHRQPCKIYRFAISHSMSE
jgi:hypothetical protein